LTYESTQLLTDSSSIPLLTDTCIHFISIILSERGLNDGQDSYPVFHVTPVSTLAHTVAKLVATRSHRMWIVDSPSPAGSVPPSPSFHPTAYSSNSQHVHPRPHTLDDPTHSSPGSSITGHGPGAAVSAAVLPGQNMSGRLTGVVSLTDVLNLFARASGLSPKDPEEERQRRRRSSSSSLRPSMDSLRSSIDLGRSSSTSGGRR
jgi:CBS domain-containing protein